MRTWKKNALIVALSAGTVVAFSQPPLTVTQHGTSHKVRTAHGDELIKTPVVLSDASTEDVEGGTVAGLTMVGPDGPLPEVGRRVKKAGKGRLLPEDQSSDGAHAYTYGGHRWPDKTLKYYVNVTNPKPPNTLTAAQVNEGLSAAALRWVQQTGAEIKVVALGGTTNNTLAANGHNDIFFREGPSEVAGRGAAVYYYWKADGYLWDADMITYKGWGTWYALTASCVTKAWHTYADDTWTHEFGHFAGFSHSTLVSATLYPSIPTSCNKTWRSLSPDDIALARTAYGLATTAPSAPTRYRPTTSLPFDGYVRWYAATGAVAYDIYFGEQSTPLKIATVDPVQNVCISNAEHGSLYFAVQATVGKTYYWRVVAVNPQGQTSSPLWSFTR